MIQLGAYAEFWPDIRTTPEGGVRAHLDLQGGRPGGAPLPIHWGTFNLAPHAWAEPGEWTRDAAGEAGQAVAFPAPASRSSRTGQLPGEPWWRGVRPSRMRGGAPVALRRRSIRAAVVSTSRASGEVGRGRSW